MATFEKNQEKYMDLDNAENALAWLKAFKAKMRVKGIKDDEETQVFKITDSFLACAGTSVVKKLTSMMSPEEPESYDFKKIEATLKRYLEPEQKLVISERVCFSSTCGSKKLQIRRTKNARRSARRNDKDETRVGANVEYAKVAVVGISAK